MQGHEWPWQQDFVFLFRYLSQISLCISTGTWRLTPKYVQFLCISISLSVTRHCTQSCAVHRELQYTKCKKMNHDKIYSRGFCCIVAGVLSGVSNKIGNEGVKNSPSTWFVRITVMHCFETSEIATQRHGDKRHRCDCIDVTDFTHVISCTITDNKLPCTACFSTSNLLRSPEIWRLRTLCEVTLHCWRF